MEKVNTGDRRLSQLKHCTPSAPQYLPNVSPPPWRCLCILSQPLVRSHSRPPSLSRSPSLPRSLSLSLSLLLLAHWLPCIRNVSRASCVHSPLLRVPSFVSSFVYIQVNVRTMRQLLGSDIRRWENYMIPFSGGRFRRVGWYLCRKHVSSGTEQGLQ